ncbi:MAG: RDD family protein [Candidatus Bathyarchaeia archaeon]|jgi:uncharacterized RDD family membrane protein YckC
MYCKKCGKEIADDIEYCPGCGAAINVSELELASIGERFLAFIIDSVLVGFVVGVVFWPGNLISPHVPFLDLGFRNMALFLYWTYTEGTTGQSLGKKIMKIKVTDLQGEPIEMSRSLYQAIGKAFLLPLDAIVGLMMYQDKEQRLFNHLSETIVVRE